MTASNAPAGLRRAKDDAGVTLILFALAIVGILTMVALVIDMGFVRDTRQDNKRTTDAAAAAGLQSLATDDDPVARPWRGVCSALRYLEANQPDLDLTITYRNGVPGPSIGGNPCTDADLQAQECVANTPATWAWIEARAGEFVTDIRSGYVTPDPAFPEDATVYSDDDGDPVNGGCDQLAVILKNRDPAFFGGVAGATGYDTVARSVGRVEIDNDAQVAIALVLLEEEDCPVLAWVGTGSFTVRGTGDRPGIIHSDSSGTGDGCGGGNVVLEGKQQSGPLVRALVAPDGSQDGVVSTYARFLGGTNDAKWNSNRYVTGPNPTEVWMCDPDSGLPGPTECDTAPSGGRRVTREPADERYIDAVTDLRRDAKERFGEMSLVTVAPPEYSLYTDVGGACTPPNGLTTITAADAGTHLYVNCDTIDVRNNRILIFEDGITHVAFKGNITFQGTARFEIQNPRNVLINNSGNADNAIAVTQQSEFSVNGKGFSSCEGRWAADPSETTELVIRTGGLSTTSGALLQLCSTFVHLMGGSTDDSPLRTTANYPSPYPNMGDTGTVNTQAGSRMQWTAPNTVSGPPTEGDYPFEDLALWTETQRDSEIGGGGAMVLKGVYYLPNTGPDAGSGGLSLSGGGSGDINLDAQLWVRKLKFNGSAAFSMRSNPADSVPVPFIGGIGMVR